jgi:hypothetical protein
MANFVRGRADRRSKTISRQSRSLSAKPANPISRRRDRTRSIFAIPRQRNAAAILQRMRSKARLHLAGVPPGNGPTAGRPNLRFGLTALFGPDRGRSSRGRRRWDFLRLRRRDHLRSRRRYNVGGRLGQIGTLLGLRLFQWRRRADHVRLRNGDWLFGLWIGRHSTQTQSGRHSFPFRAIANSGFASPPSFPSEAPVGLSTVRSCSSRSADVSTDNPLAMQNRST